MEPDERVNKFLVFFFFLLRSDFTGTGIGENLKLELNEAKKVNW